MTNEQLLTTTPTQFNFERGIITPETQEYAKLKLGECYEEILRQIKLYVDIPEDSAKFIAVWIIGTYFHEQFNSYPYLFFNAMRGSGKTRTLKLISSLASKGDGSVQNNLTEAVLFRIPRGVTTCIDEVEQIRSKEKQTLRELLNSAYKKGTKIKRMRKRISKEGEEQVTEVFEPYFPIAMANINGVEEVLADRSIVLVLEKSDKQHITKMIEDFDTNPIFIQLKRTLTQIYVVSVCSYAKKMYKETWNKYINNKYNYTNYIHTYTTQTTQTTEQEIDEDLISLFNKIDELGIGGRNFELLMPLLIVAKQVGESCFEDIMKIGSSITNAKKEDEYTESKDVSLFHFVTTLDSFGSDYFTIKDLTSRFREYIGDTDDRDDTWLNERWVGRALKRLNLIVDKRRVTQGVQVTLNYAKAKEKIGLFKTEQPKQGVGLI